MRKKYNAPYFEVEKLTILQAICASQTGEIGVPEYGMEDDVDDVGEGGVPEYGMEG